MTSYDVFHGVALNWMSVLYFFLGGLSAGCFFLSVLTTYWKKEYKPIAKSAAVLAPIFLAIGMLLLILDLGKPFRFWRLMLTFQPSSAASWGTWLLSIFFVLSLVYARLVTKGEEEKAKPWAYLGLPFALAVGTYTGMLLAQMQGIALWHTALLPWLFLLGGLISALALMILIAIGSGRNKELGDKFFNLGRLLAWLVLLEVGMIFSEVIVLSNGSAEAVASVRALLAGSYSFLFWILEIALGAIVPLIILFNRTWSKSLSSQSVASLLVLIGVLAMRFGIVLAGQI